MAGNTVYVQGNYVDVHDNEVVNLSIDKVGTLKVEDNGANVIPPQLDTPHAHELWEKAIAQGWVDEQWHPLISRPDAALLAGRMAEVLKIDGWKAFEQMWNRRNMRQDYLKGMGKQSISDFLDELRKTIR